MFRSSVVRWYGLLFFGSVWSRWYFLYLYSCLLYYFFMFGWVLLMMLRLRCMFVNFFFVVLWDDFLWCEWCFDCDNVEFVYGFMV